MDDYKKRVKELEFELKKYKTAIDVAGLDIFDINFKTGEAHQSDNIATMLGYEKKDVDTFEKRNSTFHPKDLQDSLVDVERLRKGEIDHTDLLFRLYSKDGDLFYVKHDGKVIIDETTNTPHFVGMLRDITMEKLYLEELKQLANYDGLTNAYNRRAGLNKLVSDIESDSSITVSYIDLNNFKHINDSYGHETGDMILRDFVKEAYNQLPPNSYIVRLGGDEFLIVMIGQNKNRLEQLVQSFKDNPITFANNQKLTFSSGVVVYDKLLHQSVDALLHAADQEMYIEKKKK